MLPRLQAPTIDALVAELARSVHDFVRARPGRRLVGVGLRVPPEGDYDDFEIQLRERLQALALGRPAIHLIRGGERPVLLSVELLR